MDLETVKAQATEETNRVLQKKHGLVPDPESDEWQDEYRRQFAAIKAKPPAKAAPASGVMAALPPLRGAPAQARWAETLRDERLKTVAPDEVRVWLARTWLSAKDWLDTRDLPLPAFQRRVGLQYAEERRNREAQASAAEAERAAKAKAAAEIAAKIEAAGITAEGLVELVDVSTRVKAAAIKVKLAELRTGDRHLRLFETTNPAVLLVIEDGGEAGRQEYGIERDEGLVADLRLFAQGEAA